VIGAATAFALENARRREKEEAAQKAAAEAKAAAFNAVEAVIDEQQRQIKALEWLQEKAEEMRKATALAIQQSLANQRKHLFSEPDETINNDSELLKAEKILNQTISGERPWETLNLQQSLNKPKATDVCYVDPSKNPQKTIDSKANLTDGAAIGIPILASGISNTGKPNTDTWWGKTINWVDNHQVAVSIGIGVLAGVIVLATGGLAAPAVAAVLIGMAAAAGVSAGGTLALNAYYQRDLTQNLVRNTLLAGSTAVLTGIAPTVVNWTIDNFTILSYALTSTVEDTNFFYGELQAIKTVAPAVIGTLTTLVTLAGLEGFNYAVSEVVDPTISETEKDKAKEIGNVAATSALSGMTAIQTAAVMANSFINQPENEQTEAMSSSITNQSEDGQTEEPTTSLLSDEDMDEYINGIPHPQDNTSSNRPYMNPKSRPHYANGQIEKVWENAMDEDGNVYDPYTGEKIFWEKSDPRNGQWDMGHVDGREYFKLWTDYKEYKISYKEFITEYQNPENYQPQSIYSNRSRN
jgi:hypothetical protein